MSTRHALASTRLGELLLVADGDALIGVYFPGHTYPPAPDKIGERVEIEAEGRNGATNHAAVDEIEDPAPHHPRDPLLTQAARELREYLAGERQRFEVAIATFGDPTSELVWQHLLEIPYGETTTYGAIATALGRPGLAQRVGQAVGHNPISIIIPCHRVLGADGSLTGYAGGLDRKRALLDLEEPEAAQLDRLF